MNQTELGHDITIAITRALDARRDQLTEARLVQHSDALLARLPSIVGAAPTTTAGLLRRYATPLHQVLCWDDLPSQTSATLADELRDITRAVILTTGPTEGMSIDAAVSLALVMYRRGIARFCALRPSAAG